MHGTTAPMTAQPHDGPFHNLIAPKPFSLITTLTCLHLNLINIIYYNL